MTRKCAILRDPKFKKNLVQLWLMISNREALPSPTAANASIPVYNSRYLLSNLKS